MAGASSNFASLTHDLNAGRHRFPELPASLRGTDAGRHLADLTAHMSKSLDDIQRAFRTLGVSVGAVEQTIVTDITFGTNSISVTTARAFILAIGASGTTTISGTNCA